jgi:hypothetical protein
VLELTSLKGIVIQTRSINRARAADRRPASAQVAGDEDVVADRVDSGGAESQTIGHAR